MARYARVAGVIGIAGCCAMAAAAACSSFSGDPSSPEPEAGVESAAPVDGGGSPDAAFGEASADAPSTDSGCGSATNVICDDFERDDLVGTIWSTSASGYPGSIGLTDAQAVSPTRSIRLRIEADAGAGAGTLTKNITKQNLTRIRCSFSFFPTVLSENGASLTTVLRYQLQTNIDSEASLDALIFAGSTSTGIVVNQQAPDGGNWPTTGQNTAALPNQWNAMVFEVNLASRVTTLSRDGAPIITTTGATAITKNSGVSIRLGIGGQSGLNDYFLDDLVCDVW